ncbi:MAG: peptidylprolyl isomerase [Clostridiaceae bacterium]|nr:peptidylprolyl isomerase [Eubacteriales bacterium]
MQHKRNRAPVVVVSLLMAALMLVTGCSAVISNPVVGKVGDVEILYSQFSNLYSNYMTYYQYGLITLTGDDPDAELKQMVFDALINSAIPVAQAHKEHIALDAEDEKQLAENVQAQLDAKLAEYADKVDESITDEAAIKEAEKELFIAYLKDYKLTYDAYAKLVEQDERENMLAEKLKAQAVASAAVTEEEVKAWYDEQLGLQQANYAQNPGDYYTDWQSAQSYGTVGPLVAPEGYFYVKHILVKNPAEGEEKDVDAIVAEIEEKLAAGEDFDALIAQYNEDTGMTQEANKNGYLLSEANADSYYAEFSSAALALAVGEVSAPVTSSAGVHIIKKVAAVDTTPITFDAIKEKATAQLLSEKQNKLYSEALETWRAGLTIVQYDARVKTVGQS